MQQGREQRKNTGGLILACGENREKEGGEGKKEGYRRLCLILSLDPLQTNSRMGELAEKIQDLEFIVDIMEGVAVKFKPTAAAV